MASLGDYTRAAHRFVEQTDRYSVRADRLAAVANLPTREALPLRALQAAVDRLRSAERELLAATSDFEQAARDCRDTLGLKVTLDSFGDPSDPPLMPVES